jgi:hypothetical protein
MRILVAVRVLPFRIFHMFVISLPDAKSDRFRRFSHHFALFPLGSFSYHFASIFSFRFTSQQLHSQEKFSFAYLFCENFLDFISLFMKITCEKVKKITNIFTNIGANFDKIRKILDLLLKEWSNKTFYLRFISSNTSPGLIKHAEKRFLIL